MIPTRNPSHYSIAVIGAGAAGLMCAVTAARRGRSVVLIDHNDEVGSKIRVSGGGRCNFSNRNISSSHYISENPHFVKSALARFTADDLTAMLEGAGITSVEEDAGQLFCRGSARAVTVFFEHECNELGVKVMLSTRLREISKEKIFRVKTSRGQITADSLVVAAGGLSYPKLGASDLGLRIAGQFGLRVVEPRPGLVPFLFSTQQQRQFSSLAGISHECRISIEGRSFRGGLLFTHRGLSGPAVLQASSFWQPKEPASIDLFPDIDILEFLLMERERGSRAQLATLLARQMRERFARAWCEREGGSRTLCTYTNKDLQKIAAGLRQWEFTPAGTEGYGKAEVTVGGVDTRELSSQTMEARSTPGLYFIGEVMDVTGWLGGYNLHWAFASGHAAGTALRS